MNGYKVGDKVRCINHSFKSLVKDKIYTISWCYGDGYIVLTDVDGSWCKSNFELLQEDDAAMKGKFKVGDKVVRTIGDFGFIRERDVCLVTGLRGDGQLEFDDNVDHCYSPINFELYIEEDVADILTPLQVLEHLLNGEEPLEYRYSKDAGWKELKPKGSLKISSIDTWEFRLKPKTIVINGVEVPAPRDTAALGYPDKVYGLNFSRKSVYDTTGHTDKGLFWATKEDAQQVLGAMLIPFNDL